jgi:predicted 2-oxoglutarate/Fe(II)-dependent dioxygenase YbiX
LNNVGTTSLTEVLWCNYLIKHLKTCLNNYYYFHNLKGEFLVNDIQILKYGKGDHYQFHTDHSPKIPRHHSCIFMINDDYEGGDLCFKYPNSEKTTTIEKKENRMIIWPSNVLYPHCVLPVTKGERYSVVAWAL